MTLGYNFVMARYLAEKKKQAQSLRRNGYTYGEILFRLKGEVSKSTISLWCRGVVVEDRRIVARAKRVATKQTAARQAAINSNKVRRTKYLEQIDLRNVLVSKYKEERTTQKLLLATLYWCEGSKHGSALCFGNSSPEMITVFLRLLRHCYPVDETKFRCTLQLRADQNTSQLEKFWSKITQIPATQFYETRVDARTVGKESRKKDYKGVCRINYFSAEIYHDLQSVIKLLGR